MSARHGDGADGKGGSATPGGRRARTSSRASERREQRGRSGGGAEVPSAADREAAERALAVTQRAIRRLDILEWVIFGVGAVLATLGGALVAWILSGTVGWDFRSTWIGASLLLFIVPGAISIFQIRKEERAHAARLATAARNANDPNRDRNDG